ncbi:MAG: DUF58 domain-containing protein, partial [Pseudomonadales bacterium]|nr:DUF58 domain-containing protein [Pseudomonadales bacterium]
MALSGKGALGRFIELRYREWLDKRIPPAETIRLNQKNVFIFPVALSFAYILCVAILWIAATNYENNLAFAMCFLLLSLFVITILHTFNNLSGLVLGRLDCPPVFSGNLAECRIMVSALNQRSYHSITLCWDDDYKTVLDLEPGEKKKVVCKVRVNKRGYFSPGRLRIETVYPLGILRSWSYVNLDFRILVYPKPLKFELPALGANSQE